MNSIYCLAEEHESTILDNSNTSKRRRLQEKKDAGGLAYGNGEH